uniref:rab11 family-interacting protein 1 n=1 Tax=Doryrhamphus excisus TaxID=161450 RepID=UPI0025ADB756|nr:rab11 family-interacting protein 1 [Doryrhamphus excisus]XP_057932613.1 rab11 family-interacting protein 1 [Doryrhamphus excisus]
MMSLIDLDDEQRWVPTHVNVTVLRARGLRTKSKHGSRYLYAVVQVGKDKYTTGLVDKAEVPEWGEECCFELLPGILEEGGCGRSAYPPGSADLILTVMHRVLIGLDVFLGQTVIPLDRMFQDGMCPRDEWFKLHSKAGRKEKERGELQLTVQFTRNNMTASMFDLTAKDEQRSAFGKLKDRVTGRKRPDVESSSAILPGRYAALSASTGPQSSGDESAGAALRRDNAEIAEEKRSKMKDFFTARLRKSSNTRSCSSLASEISTSSIGSDTLSPPPSLGLLSDLPSSPIYTTVPRVDAHYGEQDLTKSVLTSQQATKILTHKRAYSDEASKIITSAPKANPTVESLKGQSMTQSKSSLCINGSHVYDSEPSSPKNAGALPSKLVLLENSSSLSRSLQNLTKRSDSKGVVGEGRRWSFDRKKEEKDEDKDARPAEIEAPPLQAEAPILPSAADSADKGWKLKKTLFSGGRSDSLPAKSDANQAGSTSEGRLRGWFGSSESQNKPRLEVSPKVENTSAISPPSSLPDSHAGGHCSPINESHTHPMTPPSTPISPSNPFFEELQRSPPFAPGSSPSLHTFQPSGNATPSSTQGANNMASIKRERPRPVTRQISLPEFLPKAAQKPSMFESTRKWEDSFDTFASSRLNSPKGNLTLTYRGTPAQTRQEAPPPLPPRRPLRPPVNEIYSDGWLHRGQELAVQKEACLLSQTGVASLQHGREAESKMLQPSVSDVQRHRIIPSSGFRPEERLQKFKYEPLEDNSDFWGGMLFEQDLYGRLCTGNVSQPAFPACNNAGRRNLLAWEMSVDELLRKSSNVLPKTPPPVEPLESSSMSQTVCMNNNVTCSPNLSDHNMNVNNSDISFIDSDGSSQSEVVDDAKGLSTLSRTGPQVSQDDTRTPKRKLPSEGTEASITACEVSTVYQKTNNGETQEHLVRNQPDLESDSSDDKKEQIENGCDDNGNPQVETDVSPRVVSARVRPKGGSRGNSRTDLGPLSCLVKEGPSSYQPMKASLSSNVELDSLNKTPQISSSSEFLSGDFGNGKPSEMAFEVLHARVAPHLRSPPKTGQASSPPLLAHAPAHFPPPPACCPSIRPLGTGPHSAGVSRSLSVAPYTSSTAEQPRFNALTSLLPEETRPACNLPLHQESRSHPVKPLSQSEKKESRSVLEKLKSTISPGRSAQQVAAEPEKIQEPTEDRCALYQHLTNMELISLLLQQDMDLHKQQAASERQQAQLEKCESELKKVKAQVRDLEDYIDNLLLRIMEQTPTLLQVRSRHK